MHDARDAVEAAEAAMFARYERELRAARRRSAWVHGARRTLHRLSRYVWLGLIGYGRCFAFWPEDPTSGGYAAGPDSPGSTAEARRTR